MAATTLTWSVVLTGGIVAVLLPQLAVALEQRLAVGMLADEGGVVAVARREVDAVAVAARAPGDDAQEMAGARRFIAQEIGTPLIDRE